MASLPVVLCVLALLLTACMTVSSTATKPASCGSPDEIGLAATHQLDVQDAGHLQLRTTLQLFSTPEMPVAFDVLYLVNGEVKARVNDQLASCSQAVTFTQTVAATAQDAVSVIFTRSIREKLEEIQAALQEPVVGLLISRPLSEAETFQDSAWSGAAAPSGVPTSGAVSRVSLVGEHPQSISASVFPAGTPLELGLANALEETVGVTVACFNNRTQILVGGQRSAHVKLRPDTVIQLPLEFAAEPGLNYVQCYSLRAVLANGKRATPWAPIFAAIVQGS
ncbi:hypothetical protein E7T06_14460 [Deinococcus sp. Arct2-2]|uniref:hypothetical protein n=1 Tax=Deinococcus sp. Arct2-2 TaxID=2568653 RepID=UPI0010A3EDB8|nr:hypothetical protein [Deinococcus sp. Arct2-2]THF68867.1 hypothetical protein E7T06_14460 [Deinococcus sp. Arct2-2]